jgi:hypothetical protein
MGEMRVLLSVVYLMGREGCLQLRENRILACFVRLGHQVMLQNRLVWLVKSSWVGKTAEHTQKGNCLPCP